MSRRIRKFTLCCLMAGILSQTGCLYSGRELELKGKVVDENTHALLPGRKVIVYSLIPDGRRELPQFSGQFSTDSSGHFRYFLRNTKDTWFYNFSLAGDTSYAFSSKRLGLYDLRTNGKFLTFTMPKLASLAISIEKTSHRSAGDILYVSWRSDSREGKVLYPPKVENYGTPPDVAFRWKGPNVRSVIRTRVFADKKTEVTFILIRKGKKSEFSRTISCNREGENIVSFRY